MGDIKPSKAQLAKEWLSQHQVTEWGKCIHCCSMLNLVDSSLICLKGHRFDMARQGYFFLSKRSLATTKYDKLLFTARRHIIRQTPFYNKMHFKLAELINQIDINLMIDAGSGEGSHLASIMPLLTQQAALIGVDLAKDGIQLATDYNTMMLSLVADLANLPLQSQSTDIILSILSPSNYQEFKRVLKPQGSLIKVIPNRYYLQEIRQLLKYLGIRNNDEYDNRQVVNVFQQQFTLINKVAIYEQITLNIEDKKALVQMTPLAWNLTEEQRTKLVDLLPNQLTLDITVLIGQKL